jgi:hypothetical protein
MVSDQSSADAGRVEPFSATAQSAGCSRPIAADAMRDLPLSKRPERTILAAKPPEAGNAG